MSPRIRAYHNLLKIAERTVRSYHETCHSQLCDVGKPIPSTQTNEGGSPPKRRKQPISGPERTSPASYSLTIYRCHLATVFSFSSSNMFNMLERKQWMILKNVRYGTHLLFSLWLHFLEPGNGRWRSNAEVATKNSTPSLTFFHLRSMLKYGLPHKSWAFFFTHNFDLPIHLNS